MLLETKQAAGHDTSAVQYLHSHFEHHRFLRHLAHAQWGPERPDPFSHRRVYVFRFEHRPGFAGSVAHRESTAFEGLAAMLSVELPLLPRGRGDCLRHCHIQPNGWMADFVIDSADDVFDLLLLPPVSIARIQPCSRGGDWPVKGLFVEDEKATLDVLVDDTVPHHERAARAEGVTEADLLARRQRGALVRSTKATLAGI